MAPMGLSGISAVVRGSEYQPKKLLEAALYNLGCSPDGEMRLHIGACGRRLSVFEPGAGYIWPEQVLALNCLIEFEKGNDVALPYDAPLAIDRLAEKYGKKVRRYLSCPADGCDANARVLASNQMWVRDGLMMSVRILYYLRQNNTTLSEMMKKLPGFAVATKTVDCGTNPGRVLRRLSDGTGSQNGEGARIQAKNGHLLVRPSKKGSRLVLIAEAADTEMAAELCGELEQKLATVFLDIERETK